MKNERRRWRSDGRAWIWAVLVLTTLTGKVKAAALSLEIGGTITQTGIGSPISVGTRWTVTRTLGSRAESIHIYGIDLMGKVEFAGLAYSLSFEAAQVEFDPGIGDRDDDWAVSLESETPDNPSETNPFANYVFDELFISLKPSPWWREGHAPPVGSGIPAGYEVNFLFSIRSTNPADPWQTLIGSGDTFIATVPEPRAFALALLAAAVLKGRRRSIQ